MEDVRDLLTEVTWETGVIWRPAGQPRQSHKDSQVGATSSPPAARLPW
jgi:hypothetical protein